MDKSWMNLSRIMATSKGATHSRFSTNGVPEFDRMQEKRNQCLSSQMPSNNSSHRPTTHNLLNANHQLHSKNQSIHLSQEATNRASTFCQDKDIGEQGNRLFSRRMQYSTRSGIVGSRLSSDPLFEQGTNDRPSTLQEDQEFAEIGRHLLRPTKYSIKSGMMQSKTSIGPLPNPPNDKRLRHQHSSFPTTSTQRMQSNTIWHSQTTSRQEEFSPSLHRTNSQPPSNSKENVTKGINSPLKRKRGPRRMDEIWALPEGELIKVEFNDNGQPIGDNAKKLVGYLGVLARKGTELPLDYSDWRAVPSDNKDIFWDILKSKFDGIKDYKEWIMKSLGKKWKDYKCKLKVNYYDKCQTDEERIANCPETVIPAQWEKLVYFWSSPMGQQRSVTNKSNRSKLITSHTAGTKSFARVNHDEGKKKGVAELSRAELFVFTHTKKNEDPMNEASRKYIESIRELQSKLPENETDCLGPKDIFAQVFGKEKHGHIRGIGLGPTPSELFGPKHTHETCIRMAKETKIESEKKLDILNEKVREMEEKYEKMMAMFGGGENCEKMMAMFSNMQKRNINEQLSSDTPIAPSNPPEAAQAFENKTTQVDNSEQEVESSSSSHLAKQHQELQVNKRQRQKEILMEETEIYLKSPYRPYHTVARGILVSKNSLTQVGGERLGTQFWEVYIEVPIIPSEKLIRSYGNLKTIGDAAFQSIAWPSTFVEYIRR